MDKPIKYTSPFGKAIYPHLQKPDTHFAKGDMTKAKYHVKLELNAEDAKELVARCDNVIAKAILEEEGNGKKKKTLKKSEFTGYTKEKDGDKYIFHFKMKANGVNSKTGENFSQRPAIVDNDLKPLDPDINVWGGSILRVSYTTSGWYSDMLGGAGCTLRLKSVQVKDLVEGSSNNNGNHGFDKVEGDASNKNESSDEEVASTDSKDDF